MSVNSLERDIKRYLEERRNHSKATLKDLRLLLECDERGDFSPMFNTRLYTCHSGEYCEALFFLEAERGVN